MHQKFRFKLFAAGALALSVTACQTTRTMTESDVVSMQQESTETTQTERQNVATADPLAAMVGTWRGKWGGESQSSIEINGTADEPAVRYCFRGECWQVEDASLADGVLSWTDSNNHSFSWRLDGEVLRGQFRDRNSSGKRRVKMRRLRETYGIEAKDWGVAQTTVIRTEKFHAPTPRLHALAATITTKALYELIATDSPVLVDVLRGEAHRTIPGAIWLKGAGDDMNEDINDRLAVVLGEVTKGDRTRAVVFFCLSAECWLSHNAALRAVALGYENVHWYRGGINAWKKAKLPTERTKKTTW